MTRSAHRGEIVTLVDDPRENPEALRHYPDGLMIIADGLIEAIGSHDALKDRLDEATPLSHHREGLILPGFIDCHVHFPQLDCVASPGQQLMDWLEHYIFPAEAAFADPDHARAMAPRFLEALLREGTTTALVFGSSHACSVEALFEAALARNMRLIAGDVLMDRLAPEALLRSPEQAEAEARALIRRWRGRGRLGYAVTPRFAPACTPAMLDVAAWLLADHPETLLQTHLAENVQEMEAVARLFPDARDYLDVYQSHGLVGDRSLFAHAIHLDKEGYRHLSGCGASIAFCPSSNLFLGSGLFPYETARGEGVRIGLGSDIGAGTSLSLMRTIDEAYKVCHLQGSPLAAPEALWLATLGGARAIRLDEKVGSLEVGKEADFLLLDGGATPLLAGRLKAAASLDERLFALMMLGDDRTVGGVWLAGERQAFQGATP